MNRLLARSSLFIAFSVITAVPLSATSYTSSQSGNWSSASTWGNAGVPGSADTVSILGGHTVTLDVPATVTNLTLTGNVTGSQNLIVTSTFNWNGGTQSGSGTTSIPAAAVMNLSGYGTLDARPLNVAGTFNVTSTDQGAPGRIIHPDLTRRST